jgi:RNA recognition motif-containing protein
MNPNDTRGRRQGRGGRRPYRNQRRDERERDSRGERRDDRDERFKREEKPKKVSFWSKLIAFFTGGPKKQTSPSRTEQRETRSGENRSGEMRDQRRAAPPERVEVTTPKLYVGNLSYDATESDLFELFKGVGQVQNAEVVSHKGTHRSKGFGFVTMLTVDEAKRAVQELHDKEFMGRKLVVSGSKSEGPRDA